MKPSNKVGKLTSLLMLLVGIWVAWKWRLSGDTWYLLILLSLLALAIVFDRIRRGQRSPWPQIVKVGGGNVRKLKQLIDSGVDVYQAEENEGRTALMEAVSLGRLKNIELLIDSGADVNAKDKYGRTALMEAAYWGYVDAVKMLIEAGADIDARSDTGMTALDFATSNGSKKAAEVLRSLARGR